MALAFVRDLLKVWPPHQIQNFFFSIHVHCEFMFCVYIVIHCLQKVSKLVLPMVVSFKLNLLNQGFSKNLVAL